MKRISILITLLTLFLWAQPQGFEKVYEEKVNRSLLSMIEGDDAEYYLSNKGDFLVINTPDWYQLVSGLDGKTLASGDHMKKSAGRGIASALLGSSNAGALMDGEALKESSGFFAFEEENVVLFLDWTLEQNKMIAFDSQTGEKLWETIDYRFTPGKDDQMSSVLASIAVSSAISQAAPAASATSGMHVSVDLSYIPTSYGSQYARAFITPLPGTGDFILKTGQEHYCLNIRTGEKQWKYDDYPVNIAEAHMMPEENLVALVNFNPSYFAKSDNYVIFLDVNTGEEKYRIEHLNNYVQNRTHIRGDRLVLDYYGLEIFDIKKEQRMVLSIDPKVVKASNTVSSLFGSGNGEKNKTSMALPSVIGEKIAYTATNKVGKRVYPLTGGGRNIRLHAYDLKTGEKLWSTRELENGSQPLDLASGQVIMKHQKGLNKHIFYGVDIKTGELTGATDKIKQYLLRDDAGFVTLQNSILFSGKKGLYLYNLENWSLIDEIDVKDADIGKLQAIDVTDDGLFMVGDKGVAFYDEQGNFTGNLEIRRVEGSVWNHEVMIVFTKKNIESVSLKEYKKTGSLSKQENVIFSDNLKNWLFESSDFLEKYTLTLP